MILYCQWKDCKAFFEYSGRGRRPKYCDEHKKASKQQSDKSRPKGGHARKVYPQCCIDSQEAGVKATGSQSIVIPFWDAVSDGHARITDPIGNIPVTVRDARIVVDNARVCQQHKTAARMEKRSKARSMIKHHEAIAERNVPDLAEVKVSLKFRLSFNPPDDLMVRDPRLNLESEPDLERGLPASYSGYSPKLERQAREFMKASIEAERQAEAKANEFADYLLKLYSTWVRAGIDSYYAARKNNHYVEGTHNVSRTT